MNARAEWVVLVCWPESGESDDIYGPYTEGQARAVVETIDFEHARSLDADEQKIAVVKRIGWWAP